MKTLRGTRALLAGGALCAALSACAYNEQLGRNQLLLVDDTALAQSAAQAWQETLSTQRVSRDAAANARVRRIGSRIVEAAGMGNRPWEYVVFESPQVNAFVLPGGRMGVNTGLLNLVQNDDQLAAVIGHEVAHIVGQHAAERYSQTAATQLGLSVASGLGSGSRIGQAVSAYGGIGAQLGVLLPFSRRHELEADRLGVDLMQRAGFDPRQSVALWRRMAAQQQGRAGSPEFASTHPSDATRIAKLEEYLRSRGWA